MRLKPVATLFVCIKCTHGKRRRRELKRAIEAAGRKRELRVVSCGCLDLCPKRGTAAVLAGRVRPARCAVIDDRADAASALGGLLDGGLG